MSRKNEALRRIRDHYGLEREDFWQQKFSKGRDLTLLTHDACEKIAAIEGIIIEEPTCFFDLPKKTYVLLASARLPAREAFVDPDGNQHEARAEVGPVWSIGEADPDNCRTISYRAMMAEKRLKDRLILKLINAYEYGIYSQDEIEDADINKRYDFPDEPEQEPEPEQEQEQEQRLTAEQIAEQMNSQPEPEPEPEQVGEGEISQEEFDRRHMYMTLTELQKTANMVGDPGLKIIRQVADEEWQLRVQDLSVEQLNQLVQKVAAVWGVENLQNIFENSLKLTEDHFLAA